MTKTTTELQTEIRKLTELAMRVQDADFTVLGLPVDPSSRANMYDDLAADIEELEAELDAAH